MRKFFGLLAMAVPLLSLNAQAQSYAETAMMFSRTKPSGSARIIGMGGAQISLGGDFSSAYSNPAGLGMYNRSEVAFSPGYATIKTDGDYLSGGETLSTGNTDITSSLSMNSLGLVFSRDLKPEGFIRGAFAITLTRTNNFNRNAQYAGVNPNTSLIDYFLEDATGDTPDQFNSGGALYNTDTELAYNNYLIGERTILDPNNDPTTYFTDVSGMPLQRETIEQRGGQSQWSFSYGANYDDKFYLGAGIGIARVRYNAGKDFREDFDDDPLSFYELDESLEIRGSGVNLTVGTIFRPVDILTIGFSAVTPTWYNMTDTWSADMNSSWKNFEYLPGEFINQESASTDIVVSEYNLSTPWRLSAGATVFFGKVGLISLDLESLNYGKAQYRSNIAGVSYETDNERIKSLYTSVLNLRLGGEVRVSALRFRAGVGAMADPYAEQQNDVNQAIGSLSGGIGYRTEKFYVDFAYVRSTSNSLYRPYTIRASGTPQPLLSYRQAVDNVVGTIGFTF
jgi:hypothetical protein